MPLLTCMSFGPPDTSDLNLTVSFIFTMRHHLIWLTSTPFNSFHLAKFGWVLFALVHQHLTTKKNADFTEVACVFTKMLFANWLDAWMDPGTHR